MTVGRELVRYKLDLVGVQEVRWDERGTKRAGDYIFLWKRKRKSLIGDKIVCTPHPIISSNESRFY
jgi:hypothetical protein